MRRRHSLTLRGRGRALTTSLLGLVLVLAGPMPVRAQDPGQLGMPCDDSSTCEGDACVDGVCCNSDCTEACGTCLAAEAAGNTPNGSCAPRLAGSAGRSDCGNLTCNGRDSMCSFCISDDECQGETYCARGEEVCEVPDRCQFQNTCEPKKALGDACDLAQDCGGDRMDVQLSCSPCLSGFCIDGVCCEGECQADEACSAALKVEGNSGSCGEAATAVVGRGCEQAEQCTSGYCVDGVCCDRECTATEACARRLKASGGDGTCGEALTAVLGAVCESGDDCSSGYCVDGVCCDAECRGSCQACTQNLKGAGEDGVCGPIEVGTDPEQECSDDGAPSCQNNGWCDGEGACQRYASGDGCTPEPCSADSDCTSSACVDGICCDTACKDECEACTAAKKGSGQDGVCGLIAAGSDPDAECVSDASCAEQPLCDGAGRCRCFGGEGGPECADDGVTLKVDETTERSCAPFRCVGASCLGTCESSADCVDKTRCNTDGRCVEVSVDEAEPDPGCGCRMLGAAPGARAVPWWLLLGLFVWRRRQALR